MRHTYILIRSLFLVAVSLWLACLTPLHADGVQQVAPSPDDMVMLLIGDPDYGSFGMENGPESGRLYFHINTNEEQLYIGLSQEYTSGGNPSTPGSYRFQIKRVSDGAIVHGPYSINSFSANIHDWADAFGPAALNGGQGYDTSDERYQFTPQAAGLYYIEFMNVEHIGYWDFTVGANGQAIPGRVYSRNWAMRAPVRENEQPECVWDREFDGVLYSYTADGFVTRIDFADSGLQPLSFTLAFNSRGPGNSGDLATDRMSLEAENGTANVAEHAVFLREPDPVVFPDGECGQLDVAPFFECTGPNTYCLEVAVTQAGQVEIVLDFNQNGIFDEGLDRRLLHSFVDGGPLMDCLDWDGRLGDGSLIDPGARINLLLQYTQGVQHWALFDGEFLKEGFCVEPIRPICNNGALTNILYWDDRNITDDAGTGQPKDGRAGCACESADCRTWNNFSVNQDCSGINDDITTGYGDKNTLNTWWFANVVAVDLVDIPLISVEIEGDTELCTGLSTSLGYTFTSTAAIANLTWSGPSGILFSGPDAPETIEITIPGLYTLSLEDVNGCSYTDDHVVTDISCATDVELDITVSTLTPQVGDSIEYTISLNNVGPGPATGITIAATLPAGLSNVHLISSTGSQQGNMINWSNLELEAGEMVILNFRAKVEPAFEYTVYAEVTAMDQEDPDSTPNNGVDTNNNGQCADDPGDEDDGDCVTVDPAACSIAVEVSELLCDPSGTPTDSADDIFTFTLTVSGANGAEGWTGTLDGEPISGTYGEGQSFGPFLISEGALTLAVNDGFFTTSCTTSTLVEPPMTCSTDCLLAMEQRNTQCQDNGTPFTNEDDTYTVEVRLTGSNASSGWNAMGGFSGAYGEWVTIGPFLISDGNVILDFRDNADPDCSVREELVAPPACSTSCRLFLEVGEAICDDNDTPTDLADDTYTFALTVTGDNTSTTWQANDENTTMGAYDQTIIMGPYLIAEGDVALLISDSADAACRANLMVAAPLACSDDCILSIEQRNVVCQDAGTVFDNTDDTYTVEVRLTGSNTGSSWNAFGSFTGTYGEWVTIGPFLISDGNVTMNFVDNENPDCSVSEEFVAPPSCSTNCRILANASETICDDNGTPHDPADDTYTFTLTVTGDNVSENWIADDSNATTGMYDQEITMGPYAVADGDFNLTLTDSADGQCLTTLNVAAPTACSDQCIIDEISVVGEVVCFDNNTPTITADDLFSFELMVSGRNTATGWTAEVVQAGLTIATLNGDYNSPVGFANYLIASGAVSVLVSDADDSSCVSEISVNPPNSCSTNCDITEVILGTPICDDKNTPTDPSDDTYTFTLQARGLNLSSSWNTTLGVSGTYEEVASFGPYLISDGALSFGISDSGNPDCQETLMVVPPSACSDECAIEAIVTNVLCHDNDTPSNPLDDTYTFELLVNSINATGGGWESNTGAIGEYGSSYSQGPFAIADGILELLITDADDSACTAAVSITPPATCSDECLIEVELVSVDCSDQMTPDDTSDDVFTYTVLVTGENLGMSWTASDGTMGAYGEIVTSLPYNYDMDTRTVVITDEQGLCSSSFEVSPPESELICPEDTDDRPYEATVQILRGQLDQDDEVFTEYPCFLASSTNPMTLGDRFFDAITIFTPDDVSSDTTDLIYTFHLFTDLNLPAGASMEGGTADGSGVLVRGDYQGVDDPCCFRMNYDDNTQGDIDLELRNPDLDTTGYFNQPMTFVQKFKQQLKSDEEFTLTLSTFAGNNVGNYAWVITYQSNDTLRLDPAETEATSETFRENYRIDLTHFDLGWIPHNAASLDALGNAIVAPYCGVDDVYFTDLLDYNENCEDAYIHRTFIKESGGQADSCEQLITLRKPDLDDVVLPPQTVTLACGEEYAVDEFGNPSPQATGYPIYTSGDTTVQMIDQVQYFNLEAFYKDTVSIDTFENIQTWDREWSVVDYCGDTTHIFRQLIKRGDFYPPTLECPLSTHVCPILNEDIMLFGVDPFECTATVDVPEPDFRGFCQEDRALDWTVTTELLWAADTTLLDTVPETGSRSVSNLERGDYLVRYSATHYNGDRVERYCRIRVADLQPPQAICETSVVIDLAEDNSYNLDALRLDRGSNDNCSELDYAVRRYYSRDQDCNEREEGYLGDWSRSVPFSCCDINQVIEVEFRIMDVDSNINGCALQIEVIDSSPPAVAGLEQQALNCQALPAAFDPLDSLQRIQAFGQPMLLNPCEESLVEMEPVLIWNDCELGSVERHFRIKDALGNFFDTLLVQRNTVTASDSYSIRFPEDITTNCVESLPGIDWVGGACSDFSVAVNDQVLEALDDECYRLARTYTVTDNCLYDGNSPASILSRDENCNGQEGEEAIWLVATNDLAYADADSDAANSLPAAGTLGADCGSTNPAGYWRSLNNTGRWEYTQIISIVDEVAPVMTYTMPAAFCATDASCMAPVDIEVLIQEFCLPGEASVALFLDEGNDGSIDSELTNTSALQGSWPNYELQGEYPIGTHAFVLQATDACGNSSEERIVFTVADCFIEQAVCATGIEVILEAVSQVRDLDGDGIEDEAAATLSAAQLAEMVGMDCSGAYRYSVNEPGTMIDFDADELILTCEDRYQTTMEVVVRDVAFNPYSLQADSTLGGPNYSTCLIEISVQDPAEICRTCLDDELEIGGGIYTLGGDPISGVRIELREIDELTDTEVTGLDGGFLFENLPFSRNFLLRPSRVSDVTNGVSLLDMILLQRHLNGTDIITDPYLLLASDVNGSGDVTYLDYVLMRELLLGRITEFPMNSSWRFVPTTYDVTDISADIPDNYRYFNLTSCQFGQDFVGVKIGDLNNSVQTDLGRAPYVPQEASTRRGMPIRLPQQWLKRGDIARIPLRMSDLDQLSGLDINLLLANDKLRLVEVEAGLIRKEQIVQKQAGSGQLKAIWTSTDGVVPNEEAILFTLVVEAITDTELERALQLSAQPEIPSMAYGMGLQSYLLNLVFDEMNSLDLLLLANYPDPFQHTTALDFVLPKAGIYTLEVRDVRGRILYRKTDSVDAGPQHLQLDGATWPAGVLYYTLSFDQQHLSRRMVKMH